MKRTEVRLLKKRIKSFAIIAVIALCVILIYKLYPLSKSEKIITTNITYVEQSTQEKLTLEVSTKDYDNGYYINLPDKINGLQVERYFANNSANEQEKKQYLVGDKYYFSDDEIKNKQTTLEVVYNTKKVKDKLFYYKSIQTTISQNNVIIDGYMPKDAEISVGLANYKDVEGKIKQKDEKLNLNIAYDIKIISSGEKYEPNDFDEDVKVRISGVVNNQSNTGLKVMHIDDDNKVEEIKEVSIENKDLTFSTESFSVYAIVSTEQVETYEIKDWDGGIATSYTWGDGTASNPYLIASGNELAYLASQVNSGETYAGVYFKIINNINLNNRTWTPIGTATDSFSGALDGQGFVVSNANIAANGNENQIYAYGIFGSISGSATNTAVIRNIAFDNIQISMTLPSNIVNNVGHKVGIVCGAMYRYTKIENVIAKNSSISNVEWNHIQAGYYPTIFVGGIVGEAAYSSTSSTTAVTNGKYVINNCYADVDINIQVGVSDYASVSKLSLGGIIGRISNHSAWPTNCLYDGAMGARDSAIMMGPVFGGETTGSTEIVSTLNDLSRYIWEGNNTLTMTSYYTNYTTRETPFTSTWTTGSTPDSTTYRIEAGPWWYRYICGVNKGIYTTSLDTTMLNMFNQNAVSAGLCTWVYEDDNFSLTPGLEITVTETAQALYTFTITSESVLANPTYTYHWFINGVVDNTRTTNQSTFEPCFTMEREVQIVVSDGINVALAHFTLKQLTLGLTIERNGNTISPVFTGTGAPLVKIDRYDVNWYEIDIVEGKTETPIATTPNYTGIELYHEYQLELTNGYEGVETLVANYVYGERKIIFVNNTSYTIDGTSYVGNDNNLGATPESAVKTYARAYELLNANGAVLGNVIVNMGNYNGTDLFDSRGNSATSYNTASSRFSKPGYIIGKYKGTNYSAKVNFACSDGAYNGKFLFADTRFEYIQFTANNGSTYFYLQGHDLTMGKGISMTGYNGIDSGDYGHIMGLSSPHFHLFCGFQNYNYASIPTNSKSMNLVLKSGTYGRIIAGGRSINGASIMTKSHNIFGSSTDYFTANITIDYINPSQGTTPDINLLVAGSTDGSIYTNTTLNIKNGKVGRILGGSIGANTATFNGYPSNIFVGSTTMNISGGDISEIFGTSLGRNTNEIYYYGKVKINVTGGIIRSALYGAGAASITGNNADFPYTYYSSYAENVETDVEINISGGEIDGNVYGGGYGYSSYLTTSVANDGGALYGNSTIKITGGTITGDVYGAGKGYNYSNKTYLAQMIGDSTINISGEPTINGNIYGGGEGIFGCDGIAKLIGDSNIKIESNLGSNIYGGGSISKIDGESNINIVSGNLTGAVYGGGRLGSIDGETNVEVNGGSVAEVYGGGQEAAVTTSNVTINLGTITSAYAGGKQAGVTTSNITLENGTATTIFGGSNKNGDVTESNVTINGGTVTDVYGGNNDGGTTLTSKVYTNGGTISNVYGGGKNAGSQTTNVYSHGASNTISNIYGGGNKAGANEANVYLIDGAVTSVYGGSNESETVVKSNVYISSETATPLPTNLNITNVYGGNNSGGTTTTSNIYGYHGTVTNVFGGGNRTNGTTTNVKIIGGNYTNVYGGSNQVGTINQTNIETTGGTIENVYGGNNEGGTTTASDVDIKGGTITAVYGGNNAGGTTVISDVTVTLGTITNVYGGNNAGGTTTNANTLILGGAITNAFGGGNQAATNSTQITVKSHILGSVYGGGNQAPVNTNTQLNTDTATIDGNIYGGGNEGIILANTNVKVTDTHVKGSTHGGGNGTTAIVIGNTNLTIDGTTQIDQNAFGGGNQAATGTEGSTTSVSTVNIVGATISGNVYGGANTSVVYGSTNVNIGNCVSNIETLKKDEILINGTVFGGGEANASGSEIYDYEFISVTNGLSMNIDANTYSDFSIRGSIFGSGNASTTSGTSNININNYGTASSPKSNVSIQRADTVTLTNSALWISGATDRTNEYSTTLFSLSRIKELKLKNNSTLYLNNGANLVEKLSSVVDNGSGEQKATVTINDGVSVTTNVDNRIYMHEGVNLNIAINEQVTDYGEIYGMFFLGLYTGNNKLSLGLYSKSYDIGDEVATNDRAIFTRNSYVLGEHKTDHNITHDGFYSNFKDEDNIVSINYVSPTPSNDVYYIWSIGDKAKVTVFDVPLTASKYNTLGTCELPLVGFSKPNTVFEYSGLICDLVDGVSLVNKNEILNIQENQQIADNKFGLGLETGRNGWMMEGKTKFLSTDPFYTGTTTYLSDNGSSTPTLNFYLYHSQNISVEKELGTATVIFTAIEQLDDLNKEIKTILIDVEMDTALYQDSFYEAAIAPGEQYELFTTTNTNITTESEFSQYYSLCINDFSESEYYSRYQNYHRALVSSIVLPANTTITMFDMKETVPEYYYYTVTAEDQAASKKIFNISDFKIMGSTDQYFVETNTKYYNPTLDIENEQFIFHFDFSNANINTAITEQSILLELRDDDEETWIGVLGHQRQSLKYSIYNTGSNISVSATTSKPSVYLGQELFLDVITDYNQTVLNGKVIYDTNYFGQKLGIKITLYDSNGEQVSGSSLLGVYFKLNGTKYFPRVDGTTRINVAGNVSNVASHIEVNTENSNLASGNYTIKVETFCSPDGIYYGLVSADETTIPISILNSIYGLSADLEDNMVIIKSEDGKTINGNNNLDFNIKFSSGLATPNIKVALYRRDYSNVYSNTYNLVDLQDYVTDSLTTTNIENTYLATDTPTANFTYSLTTKPELTTGTYKVVFSLYDGDRYVGEVYQYIIIN